MTNFVKFTEKAGHYTSRGLLGGGALGDVGRALDPGGAAVASFQRGDAPRTARTALDPRDVVGDIVPQPPAPTPPAEIPQIPTIDTARQRLQETDRLRRRRGVLANIFGGSSASQPTVATKTLLGS